jgi:hypothetical protein
MMSLARIGSYVGIIRSLKWIAHVVRAWDVALVQWLSWVKCLNVLSTCREWDR